MIKEVLLLGDVINASELTEVEGIILSLENSEDSSSLNINGAVTINNKQSALRFEVQAEEGFMSDTVKLDYTADSVDSEVLLALRTYPWLRSADEDLRVYMKTPGSD
jgi:hypothetical protein